MEKFYYLYPEKLVESVTVDIYDYGQGEIFLGVKWTLTDGKTDTHFSEATEDLFECLELYDTTVERLKWYYRDKLKDIELDELVDDFSEDDFEEEELDDKFNDVCWECVKGTCKLH